MILDWATNIATLIVGEGIFLFLKRRGAELRRVLVLGVHKLIIKVNGKEQLRLASPS